MMKSNFLKKRWWIVLLLIIVIVTAAIFLVRGCREPRRAKPPTPAVATVREAPSPTPEPSPTPTAAETVPTEKVALPAPYESEGGVPYNGTSISFDVAPREIEVYTCGPAKVAGVVLPGGGNRGSVIIMLPDSKQTVSYAIQEVITGAGWHGSYRFEQEPTEKDWMALVDDRVEAMKRAPNCAAGTGCTTVDVIVIGPNGVVFRDQR